jgi:hypothetical protein
MPSARRLLAAACAVAIGGGSVFADERTWTDASGKFKVTGTFVRERDGQIHIRCEDGRLVAIDASAISKADRSFIRDGGGATPSRSARPTEQPASQTAVPTAQLAQKPQAARKSGESAAPGTKEVIAEGAGLSKEEALKDAFRAAIRQVVGEVVDSAVQVRNDELIKDEILLYSDGFIPHHDVTAATVERGIHRVTIHATVERRSLVSKLQAAKITVKTLDDDGEDVVGKVFTEREARDAAKAMVAKAFVGFPSDQLEARVLDWKPVEDEGDHITLAIKVAIAPSKDAYKAFQQRLCQRLGDVAKTDGEFTTTMPSHEPWNGDPCRLPYVGKQNQFSDEMVKLMPAVADVQTTDDGRPKDLMVIAVATLISADSTRIDWSYFVLDGKAGAAVLSAAQRPGSCKLTFESATGEPIAVERFDPVRDQFPKPDGYMDQIPWNKYLVKIWQADTGPYARRGDSFFSGLAEYDPPSASQESLKPAVAFVAPIVFGSGWNDNLMYVPRVNLTRHVRLTEDEVRPIKKVRCEMTFRKGSERGDER